MAPPNFICLSVCLCVCVCVCPAFTAYISLTMGRILIKLGENVGTLVRLIVLKFEHSATKGNTTHKGKFFIAFLCVSKQFETIETHFFFLKILSILQQSETIIPALDCDSSDSDLVIKLWKTVTLKLQTLSDCMCVCVSHS